MQQVELHQIGMLAWWLWVTQVKALAKTRTYIKNVPFKVALAVYLIFLLPEYFELQGKKHLLYVTNTIFVLAFSVS